MDYLNGCQTRSRELPAQQYAADKLKGPADVQLIAHGGQDDRDKGGREEIDIRLVHVDDISANHYNPSGMDPEILYLESRRL